MKISTDQALDRWDTLPLVLREALYSEANSDFLWKTCEAEHIPNERIYTASAISGYVLMGFLHPEDVAVALQDSIGIDKKTATSIQSALNQRIFAPLRKEIDAVYSPLSKSETGPKIMQEVRPPAVAMPQAPVAPKIISEAFSATATGMPRVAATGMPPTPPKPSMPPAAPQAKPQPVFSQTAATGGMSLGTSPFASNKNMPGTAPKPAKSMTDAGWSKQTNQDPVVKLGIITPSVPTPMAKPSATATTGQPQQSNNFAATKNMSEFERLDMMKKGASGSGNAGNNASNGPAIPPPVMLHEVAPGASAASSPDFRIATGMQNQINKATTPPPMPVKSAVIEFAGAKPAQGTQPTYAAATPKPVHYSDYIPPAGSSRNITEISAAPSPAPAAKSMAPQPAIPPMPPQSIPSNQQQPQQTSKVIVKDFLSPENPEK